MIRTPSFRTRRMRSPAGSVRLLVDLDERDGRWFEAAVGPVRAGVERSLSDGVFADRAGHAVGAARDRWDRQVAAAVSRPDLVVVRSDVRRCYRSITAVAVDAGLRRAGMDAWDRARIATFLDGLRSAGIDGLPVGPAPSAVLATAVLAIADDAIRAEGVAHLRWVDDVVLVGERRAVQRAFAAWRGTLAELGMRVHDGKTGPMTSLRGGPSSPCHDAPS